MIYSGGLKIYSTMEPSVQKSVTQVFSNTANFPTLSGSVQPEAAMIVLDPKTGDVVAMYGGRGEKTADRTLNRAMQITRSPGSTIKPIAVYAPAFEAGVITSSDIIEDSPFNKELMWPKNYYNEYKGNYFAICN
jgi:penicillin-binding protein 1A